MRCLTLADELRDRGAECYFICREHTGNLIGLIRGRGFVVAAIPIGSADVVPEDAMPTAHAHWLGSDWQIDAKQTLEVVQAIKPDWLVVDHYAIDARWEQRLRSARKKLMVIDDLADRKHECDLLLDQNWYGDAMSRRYQRLSPDHCVTLLGPKYALLRPEYAAIRASMVARKGEIGRVLVFMGGSDPTNETAKVLTALSHPDFAKLEVDVVLGHNHPDAEGIAAQVELRFGTTLYRALPSLAELMMTADLMIGAGGSTTWERMCLGLPAIVIAVAANQMATNLALMRAGYIDFLGEMNDVSASNIAEALNRYLSDSMRLMTQSSLGQELVRGDGVSMISKLLFESLRG